MLTTRCPSCNTVFRIRAEQLNQRGGRVRCGHCHTAFLALSTLEEMPDDTVLPKASTPAAAAPAAPTPVVTPPSPPAPEPVPEPKPEPQPAPAPAVTAVEPPEPIAPPPEPLPPLAASSPEFDLEVDLETQAFAAHTQIAPDFSLDDGRIEPSLPAQVPAPEFEIPLDDEDPFEPRETAPVETDVDEERIRITGLQPELDEEEADGTPTETVPEAPRPQIVLHGEGRGDDLASVLQQMSDEDNAPRREDMAGPETVFLDEVLVPPRRVRHPGRWAAGAVFLLLLALIQAAYLFRTELASQFPELRPVLSDVCATLGCDLPYPARAEDISVEATDLNPDTTQTGRYTLTVTLRNRARFNQSWPHLELTLTDRFDRAIARRVLTPHDWLPAGMTQSPAFGPLGEITAQVGFSTELPAAGYRLYAFYP